MQEMYARGFDFLPLDIYTAKAETFPGCGDKLMPSINSIDGLGGEGCGLDRGGGEGWEVPVQRGFQEQDEG